VSATRNAAYHSVDPAPDAASVPGTKPRPALLPGVGILGMVLAGLALGIGLTEIVLDRGWDPGAVALGPWVARPRLGTSAIDPYALAGLARTGEIPLAANEGLAFKAETDDTGYRLLRTCSYGLSGPVPASRFWTLTAADAAGHPIGNAAQRSAFTSSTVIRDINGAFTIDIGPSARPGNWIPTSGRGPMSLVLRLYDTPLTANPNAIGGSALPAITRRSCATPAVGGAPPADAAAP
jgi:hypothetical protein